MNITITTTGRRSGEPRTLPLYAWPDGDRLVIVGSKGGAAKDPAWAHNLRADPRATVKKGRDTQEFRATEVEVDGGSALACGPWSRRRSRSTRATSARPSG